MPSHWSVDPPTPHFSWRSLHFYSDWWVFGVDTLLMSLNVDETKYIFHVSLVWCATASITVTFTVLCMDTITVAMCVDAIIHLTRCRNARPLTRQGRNIWLSNWRTHSHKIWIIWTESVQSNVPRIGEFDRFSYFHYFHDKFFSPVSIQFGSAQSLFTQQFGSKVE